MSQDAKTFLINEADYLRMVDSREAIFAGGALDAKRPAAWRQYGYYGEVTFAMLLQAYRRGGAAQGAVHRLLDGCWQKLPRIKKEGGGKDESPWEKSVKKVFREVKAWAKLRDFDRRNMVGHWSALIYRVSDGKELREPLGRGKLVDIVPLYEDQLTVTAWNNNQADPDFGKPTMYQYRMRSVNAQAAGAQARPEQMVDVHPSRVQIMAEGAVGDMFDGVPLLLAGFNHLSDIEKIAGGSAESYLKNSARTIVVKFEADASLEAVVQKGTDGATTTKTVREYIEDQVRSLNRNQDASMALQGGDATTLQTVISDPEPSFQVAANLFSASVQIPFTVLFGQQTGRLASDEDKADMQARCKSRQENADTPMIEEFVKRMQAIGVIDEGEFEIEWPDIAAPSDAERLDNALKLAQIAKTASEAGITEPAFDANEIRKAAGDYEERDDDGMPTEEDEAAAVEAERAHQLALKGAGPALPAPGKKPALAAAS